MFFFIRAAGLFEPHKYIEKQTGDVDFLCFRCSYVVKKGKILNLTIYACKKIKFIFGINTTSFHHHESIPR
jgi:hypothetical protein